MDLAASLLNDTTKLLYTFAVQIPYLKSANQQLEQELQAQGNQIDLISEAEITVALGQKYLNLPVSFFIPISLMERKSGTTDSYIPMMERSDVYAPSAEPSSNLSIWDFRHNCINFVGSTEIRQVRLFYYRTLPELVDETSSQEVRGGKNYLSFRTAALCARFIGGNRQRADDLDIQALQHLDLITSIYQKNQQGNRKRRRPFRRQQSLMR